MYTRASWRRNVVLADKGYDEPEADNNPDGHPRYNMVQENDIYSEQDEAWKITNADDNVFQVSAPLFTPHIREKGVLLSVPFSRDIAKGRRAAVF